MALSFTGSNEQPHFEKTSFRVGSKIFATLDIQNKRACLLLTPVDQSVLTAFDKSIIYAVPNKWGLKGATFVELQNVPTALLKDALTQAYHKTLSKK